MLAELGEVLIGGQRGHHHRVDLFQFRQPRIQCFRLEIELQWALQDVFDMFQRLHTAVGFQRQAFDRVGAVLGHGEAQLASLAHHGLEHRGI